MHSYKSSKGTSFNYNSDFSGLVFIVNEIGEQIEICGEDILEFVANTYIRPQKISKIEDKSYEEILEM